MRDLRLLYIQAIAGIVALVYAVFLWSNGIPPQLKWLRVYSVAVFIVIVLWAFWDRWLWRASLVQRMQFVPPNISGTWKGVLRSHWTDPATKGRFPQKKAYLAVKQTFSSVSVVLLTDESQSQSYSVLAKVTKVDGLSYLYLNEPDVAAQEGSHMHRGAAMFRLSDSPVSMLRGRYWTDRETGGELVFKNRLSQCADDYEMAARLFDSVVRDPEH